MSMKVVIQKILARAMTIIDIGPGGTDLLSKTHAIRAGLSPTSIDKQQKSGVLSYGSMNVSLNDTKFGFVNGENVADAALTALLNFFSFSSVSSMLCREMLIVDVPFLLGRFSFMVLCF